MLLSIKHLQWLVRVTLKSLEGKLVRWYRCSHDGRIQEAGHGVVLGHTGHFYSKENSDLNEYEILIDGAIEIFAKRDFEIVEKETDNDKSEEK